MTARGKREARRPWLKKSEFRHSPEKGVIRSVYFGLSGLVSLWAGDQGRRARCARACPWLSYFAPLALWICGELALWNFARIGVL